QAARLAAAQVIDRHSPEAFVESMQVSRSETVDRSEVTIRDQTGRAEVTKHPKRGGLRVQQSGDCESGACLLLSAFVQHGAAHHLAGAHTDERDLVALVQRNRCFLVNVMKRDPKELI